MASERINPVSAAFQSGDGRPKRYGYRIKVDEPNPDTRVEYILDAVGMKPAYMDFTGDKFEYGSWADVWFVKDNYPVMLKPDGTEDYRLSPSDYTKKIDGTTIADLATTLDNAMSAIPLCWVKRYEEDGYQYVIFCQEQYDLGYKAYAHTRKDGSIAPVTYAAIYDGSMDSETRLRSISGAEIYPQNITVASAELTAATKNGEHYNITTWALWSLLGDLCTLISKSTNSQAKFGEGVTTRTVTTAEGHYGMVHCGSLDQKGQFYGKNDTTTAVKVFCIENLWGNRWKRLNGLVYDNGIYKVKMTPEGQGYSFEGKGYAPAHLGILTGTGGNLQTKTVQTEYGRFPLEIGDATYVTYETDGTWYNNAGLRVALVGGCNDGSRCGVRCLACDDLASGSTWYFGASLSCENPS